MAQLYHMLYQSHKARANTPGFLNPYFHYIYMYRSTTHTVYTIKYGKLFTAFEVPNLKNIRDKEARIQYSSYLRAMLLVLTTTITF
jgi:hypothetical protein